MLVNKCALCFQQGTQDVQTTLNILGILSELLTVGKYSSFHK